MTTVREASDTGKKLDTLIALREKISDIIDKCESGRDIAALTKRLIEITDEIEVVKHSESIGDSPLAKARMRTKKEQEAKAGRYGLKVG